MLQAQRWARWLSGLWAGETLCVGLLAAPSAFAVLAPGEAGRLVGRLFQLDAYLGLAMGALLWALQRRGTFQPLQGHVGGMAEQVLATAAILTIALGYFVTVPLMDRARAGHGPWSFAVLHGMSMTCFLLRGVCVSVLAWRHAGAPPGSLQDAA